MQPLPWIRRRPGPRYRPVSPARRGARRGRAGFTRRAATIALIAGWCWCFGAAAAAAAPPEEPVLRVGTKSAPPFSFRGEDGRWTGIAIDLWSRVADSLDLPYELHEVELAELIGGVSAGRLDASCAAVTVTEEREAKIDFSHAYFSSGLGIAVPSQGPGGWRATLAAFLSIGFLKVVLSLLAVLFVAGALVWMFERRANTEQFGRAPRSGIGAGFWWAAVTMTTVGYGDKAPQTFGGRLVALIWMFLSLIIVSSFVAALASSLTLGQLQSGVAGPEDLPRHTVGAVAGTTGETYLRNRHLKFSSFESVSAALAALDRWDLDAVVYDRPLLRYEVREHYSGRLLVLPHVVEKEQYAIVLPEGSPRREQVNRAILAVMADPEWGDRVRDYLGE